MCTHVIEWQSVGWGGNGNVEAVSSTLHHVTGQTVWAADWDEPGCKNNVSTPWTPMVSVGRPATDMLHGSCIHYTHVIDQTVCAVF